MSRILTSILFVAVLFLGLNTVAEAQEDRRTLWESIQQDLAESSQSTRPLHYMISVSEAAYGIEDWHEDLLPGVSVGGVVGVWWTYVGVPVMIILLGFHILKQSTTGQIDYYDLLFRCVVFVAFVAGGNAVYSNLTKLQQGFPQLIATQLSNSDIAEREDLSVMNRLRDSIGESLKEVVTQVLHVSATRHEDGYLVDDTVPNLFEILENQVPWSLQPNQLSLGPGRLSGKSFEARKTDWLNLDLKDKLSDLRQGLEAYFAHDPKFNQRLEEIIRDVIYSGGDVFVNDLGSAKDSDAGIKIRPEQIREFRREVRDAFMDALGNGGFFVAGYIGGEQVIPKTKVEAIALTGSAPPSPDPPRLFGWLFELMFALSDFITNFVVMIFSKFFLLLLGLQFTLCMILVPFVFHPKTERVFYNSIHTLIVVLFVPAVAQVAIAIWVLLMKALFSSVGGAATAAGGEIGGTAMLLVAGGSFGFTNVSIVAALLNIGGMLLLLFWAPKGTKAISTGGSMAGAAIAGAMGGAIGGKAGMMLAKSSPGGMAAMAAAKAVSNTLDKAAGGTQGTEPGGGTDGSKGGGSSPTGSAPSSPGGGGGSRLPQGNAGSGGADAPRGANRSPQSADAQQSLAQARQSANAADHHGGGGAPEAPHRSASTGSRAPAPEGGALPASSPSPSTATETAGAKDANTPSRGKSEEGKAKRLALGAGKMAGKAALLGLGIPVSKKTAAGMGGAYKRALSGSIVDILQGKPTLPGQDPRDRSMGSTTAGKALDNEEI